MKKEASEIPHIDDLALAFMPEKDRLKAIKNFFSQSRKKIQKDDTKNRVGNKNVRFCPPEIFRFLIGEESCQPPAIAGRKGLTEEFISRTRGPTK